MFPAVKIRWHLSAHFADIEREGEITVDDLATDEEIEAAVWDVISTYVSWSWDQVTENDQ